MTRIRRHVVPNRAQHKTRQRLETRLENEREATLLIVLARLSIVYQEIGWVLCTVKQSVTQLFQLFSSLAPRFSPFHLPSLSS